LRRILKQVVRSHRIEAEARAISIELSFDSSQSDLNLSIDTARISWAISEILTNAIRHTPRHGAVTVLVRDRTMRRDGGVEVVIRDTGPGVSAEIRDRIFDRHFGVYDLRVARSGSIGMGLAIAREIAEGHGGSLRLNAACQSGSEFLLSLPGESSFEPAMVSK
jgi:two-component system sensor histidine kinase BaeS